MFVELGNNMEVSEGSSLVRFDRPIDSWSPPKNMVIVEHLGVDIKKYMQIYLPLLQGSEAGEHLVTRTCPSHHGCSPPSKGTKSPLPHRSGHCRDENQSPHATPSASRYS